MNARGASRRTHLFACRPYDRRSALDWPFRPRRRPPAKVTFFSYEDLLELSRYACERGIELGAQAIDRRDDRDRNTGDN